MKKTILTLLLAVTMLPLVANAYEQLADGVFQDGATLYICSGVTSLGDLQVNPSEIYCYATIPPACMTNTFASYDATLHVPVAGMVSYFTALYWYNFNNILSDAIEPLSVSLNSTDAELEIGQQLSLSATVTPSNATPNTVYWSSTNASVATVSSDGSVTAVATGECDILATCVDKVAVCHVAVVNPRVTITLDNHEARLLPNHTLTLTATCLPIDVDLAVTSSNPEVAIPRLVNGSIIVVGVAEGVATIMINAADGKGDPDSCIVTVYTEHGDVNCDGYVNIADVTEILDYLLSGDSSSINSTYCDIDYNSSVNIADATELIDYLLSGIWSWESLYTVNGVSFKMVNVQGGTFTMGASEDDIEALNSEKPAHKVTLSSFRIAQTEVTQALWLAVMGSNPSNYTGDLNRPVESVSWKDCQTFIIKLNEMTGEHFRFPTEAEWEFAARGGTKSQGYKYSGSNNITDVAWYAGNSNHLSHPVGAKAANELGLYDMSGNVWEWCQDLEGTYTSDDQTNPAGPIIGSTRVNRGGCFGNEVGFCRVSQRSHNMSSYSSGVLGLRLALAADNTSSPEEHEWVDLGLPSGTLWATMNVGACRPEEYGDYFAWGETSPKDVYSLNNYKFKNNSSYGKDDDNTGSNPEDDVAHVNWGPSWRVPCDDQINELMNNCTKLWITNDDVNGWLVTGPNGNSIFLPAAGFRYDSTLSSVGQVGHYWSHTLVPNNTTLAYYLNIGSDYWSRSGGYRTYGRCVRAVRENLYIKQQSLNLPNLPIGVTYKCELKIINNTFEAKTLTATSEAPFLFEQETGSTSSMTIVVPGNSSETVTVVFMANMLGEFKGNVTFQNEALNGGQSIIPVHVLVMEQQEYVDLGLPSGTLWATCNVGANSPEEYGDYFAWGETSTKYNYGYGWSNYRWCNGAKTRLTKYNYHAQYGNHRDNKYELELSDDAAYVNMGTSWCMPTREQLGELNGKCTWMWTTLNGVKGYLGVGPNNYTIFLPAAGFSSGYAGSSGYYWSNHLGSDWPYHARMIKFNSQDYLLSTDFDRCYGLSVRAVRR